MGSVGTAKLQADDTVKALCGGLEVTHTNEKKCRKQFPFSAIYKEVMLVSDALSSNRNDRSVC